MSNHTNSDIYYRNRLINRHVGGLNPPQLQTNDQYMANQKRVLNSQNIDLPPNIRYFRQSNGYTNFPNFQQSSTGSPYDSVYGNNNIYDKGNASCLGCNDTLNDQLQQTAGGKRDQGSQIIKEHKDDVYLRKDQDRYDPYEGFIYNQGLMSDGRQRRRIRSHYIDINSTFRITTPSTSGDDPVLLEKDPLQFQNGSNIMTIIQPNHGFEVSDPISLTGAQSRLSILRTFRGPGLPTFDIPAGCDFMKIYYDHNIPLIYNGDTIEILLSDIRGDRGTTQVASFLGSIPINVINTRHKVRMTLSDADINCSTQDIILKTNDPNYFTPNDNYFFIILPYIMHNPVNESPYTLREYNFKLFNLSITGIPVNQINASYPITSENINGYHIIKSVTQNTYTVDVGTRAISNQTLVRGGGKCIFVSKIRNITIGFPNPNQYSVDLGDTLHNVIAVRLISSEIPNTDKAIRDSPPERANNKIYWNDIDDGDYLYSIEIPSGNYAPADLAKILADAFYATPRITAQDQATREALGITYTDRHFIQPTININTDEVIFKSYKEFILQTPIIEVVPDVSDDPTVPADPNVTYQLTINHPNHGMTEPGQTILIQGAVNHKGILGSIINGEKVVTEIIDGNTYRISLPKFNLIDNRTETGGGVNVFIYIPDFFRLRFDQPDTLGKVLGFRNPGDPISVTPFDVEISNKDSYEFESGKNAVGQPIQITNNALQLSGENYIIMVAEPLRTALSIGKVKNIFAKILLCDSPGKILYNTFVPITHYYEDPLHELFRLNISFLTPDGNLFNFNGVEHSFTIEIITVNDIPEGTGINANTGKNYNTEI